MCFYSNQAHTIGPNPKPPLAGPQPAGEPAGQGAALGGAAAALLLDAARLDGVLKCVVALEVEGGWGFFFLGWVGGWGGSRGFGGR